MNKNFVIEYFDVVLFMKQKQRRKKKEKREREIEKGGGQKRLGRKKGKH